MTDEQLNALETRLSAWDRLNCLMVGEQKPDPQSCLSPDDILGLIASLREARRRIAELEEVIPAQFQPTPVPAIADLAAYRAEQKRLDAEIAALLISTDTLSAGDTRTSLPDADCVQGSSDRGIGPAGEALRRKRK